MINAGYYSVAGQIKQAFAKNKAVELEEFLDKKEYASLKKMILSAKFIRDEVVMTHAYSKASQDLKGPDQVNDFIKMIIGKKPKTWQVWSFGTKDYTVINDKKLEKPGFDAILDLSDNWKESFGGNIIYVDGSGDYTKIKIKGNMLVLVERTKKVHRFVKYVNNHAGKKKRVFLIARF